MDKKILLAGGLGGMVVPALQAGLKLTQQVKNDLDINPGYFAGILVLAAIGIVTVWFLDETERKKAFIIGLSLPATISSLGGQLGASTKKPEGETMLRVLTAPIAMLVTTAHAAEPSSSILPPPSPVAAPTFLLARQFRLVNSGKTSVTVQFLDKDGNELDRFLPNGTNLRNIPDAAVKTAIVTSSGTQQKFDLGEPAGTVTVVTVAVSRENKLGFWQALGAPASSKETLQATAKIDSVRAAGQELWVKRDEPSAPKMTINGAVGTATDYIFAKKDLNAQWTNGMLLRGDKFTVLPDNDPAGRWIKIKLTGLAPTPAPAPNRTL